MEVKEVEIGCDNNQLWIFLFVYFQLVFIFIYHLFGVEGILGYYFLTIFFLSTIVAIFPLQEKNKQEKMWGFFLRHCRNGCGEVIYLVDFGEIWVWQFVRQKD